MSLAQTPESEVHGELIGKLLERAAALRYRLILVVDAPGIAGASRERRWSSAAWRSGVRPGTAWRRGAASRHCTSIWPRPVAVSRPGWITLGLVSHTNVGKTTLARTLLRRDVGEVRDEAHVTDTMRSTR